jgi:ADP-ribose pyrophosphatase
MEQHGPWQTLAGKSVYESPWIEVSHYDVINPGKKQGQYGVVHFKNLAIGILPLDEDYNTFIVGQYRYPLKEYHWEIPEGGGRLDVPPVDSAKRELLEEVGLKAARWTEIQTMHLSNSATDEFALIYVAQDLTYHTPEPEEDEELEIRKLPFSELYEMVQKGEITDSLTVAAVLKVKLMMLEGAL